MHRLLKRQLKKHRFTEAQLEALDAFLQSIDEAYESHDADYAQLEHTLELSSKELFKANQLLQKSVDDTNLRLKQMIDSVQEIIFLLDNNGNWVYLNNAWTEVTGIAIEDAIGRSFYEFTSMLDPEDKKALSTLKTGIEGTFRREMQVTTQGGEKYWIDLQINNFVDSNGLIQGMVGTMVNITSLKKSQHAAIRASKAKDEFLSTMSHEIRTPLNAIIGITDLLRMQSPLESQMENLSALKYSSEHLLQLINDVLDFSKIEASKIEFSNSDFSLTAMLDGIKVNYSYMAEEKGIKFKIKKDVEIPDVLVGDSLRLAQILTNLIGNAIKFTKVGSVILDIDQMDRKDNEIELKFSVTDTGIGISDAKRDLIFEPFTQAESSTSKEYGGTGLGLAISKKLIELQDSSLHLDSVLGQGSTFWFVLKIGVSDNFETFNKKSIQSNPSFGGLNGLRVLVAEDNMMNVLVLKQFFKKWEIEYDLALNGQEAVDRIARGDHYQMILMDLQMPVMDGYEATRQIRKLDSAYAKGIKIIALTASVQSDIQCKSKEAGMDDYLGKPFNPKDLYQKIKYYAQLREE
jgi:PAS domain S-box-containing protein